MGGYGSFSEEMPRVLFLPVIYQDELLVMREELKVELADYYAKYNDQEFQPHMTVARIDKNNIANFLEQREKIQEILEAIDWNFPITEVALYGVNTSKKLQHQEKLKIFRI